MKRIKKCLLPLALLLFAICIGLFFGHRMNKVDTLSNILGLSGGNGKRMEFIPSDGGDTTALSDREMNDLVLLFDSCKLRYRSASERFVDCDGRIFLWKDMDLYPVEIMFSEKYIKINHADFMASGTYTIIDGGDAIRQYIRCNFI